MTTYVRITRANAERYLGRILEIEGLSFISPWNPVAFRGELGNPFSEMWALKEGGIIQGYICYWNSKKEIQILNVAVHPDYRRRGVGERLIRRVIQTGAEADAEQLWLEVRTSNRPAQNLYRKLGFFEVGRRPHYYRDTGEDAIVMNLIIPDGMAPSNKTNGSREV